jgi:hypothetical protein
MADSGGFGRSEAAEKANEFVISGLFWKVCQARKTSTPGSNPGGASNFSAEINTFVTQFTLR